MKILMVCLGNICRSPLAEGILKDKLMKQNLRVTVDSCGTSDYHSGDAADPRTIEIARKHHINLNDHRGKQFTSQHFGKYDRIYVMDRSNYNDVISLAKNQADKEKVELILNVVNPGKNLDVPDPYYSGHDGFEKVFRMLDEACNVIVDNIRNST